jgi:hypothetical protein
LVDKRHHTRRWLRYVPPPVKVREDKVTGLVIATAGDYERARAILARALNGR